MNTTIIAFGYRARRGKDTAVQTIIEEFGDKYDIRRYAFGDFLKAEIAGKEFELCMKYGLPYEPENKHRTLMQYWGTEVRRKQNPFYWIQKMSKQLAIDQPQIALISDLRMLNEFNWVQSQGGTTIKIDRLGYTDVGINTQHPSEAQLDGVVFDYEITVRDGDLEELKKNAKTVFKMIVESFQPTDMSEFTPTVISTEI